MHMNKDDYMISKKNRPALPFLLLLVLPLGIWAQKTDSTATPLRFGGAVTVTNNGISFIPTFTLGKPAVVFDMTLGRKLSFDPQFRFSMEGKPWSFVLWVRYKLVQNRKFFMNIGGHPSFVFKTATVVENGVTKDILSSQRYLAGEIAPNYIINKHLTVGVYYLTSFGLKETPTKHTHFFTVNGTLSRVALTHDLALRFSPLAYYLKMDDNDGVYYSASLAVSSQKVPLSVQYMFNTPIHSTIAGGQDFVSNISLIYSFSKNYRVVK